MSKRKDAMTVAGIVTQEIPPLTIRTEDTAMTQYYIRHAPIRCKFCDKTHCDVGLAVITRSIRKGVVYVRSRCCGRNWSLPVKKL